MNDSAIEAEKPSPTAWLKRRMSDYMGVANASHVPQITHDEHEAVLCPECSEPIQADVATTQNAYSQTLHVACAPPAPPCPEGTDLELWRDGTQTIFRAPRESAVAYALRLELFCRLFGPAFMRQKAAKDLIK